MLKESSFENFNVDVKESKT